MGAKIFLRASLLVVMFGIGCVQSYVLFSPVYIDPVAKSIVDIRKPVPSVTQCATLCQLENSAACQFDQSEEVCFLLGMPVEYAQMATEEYTEKVHISLAPGVPSEWTGWSTCSVSCGSGASTRTRLCISTRSQQQGGQDCTDILTESVDCDLGPCPVCPSGWLELPDSNKCIKLNTELLSYDEALNTCKAWAASGSLVSIHSQAQNDFLKDSVYDGEPWVYIGLHDKNTESTFQWTDGTAYDYTNFHSSEPNGAHFENCIAVYNVFLYMWTDIL